ncbi:hypothetical protein BJ875DRAFT_473599 [Amylocarpus encephaloides]|uniref:Uncharacterized protein n=1 Tax=Amylocarpus encephaloides TaxID=45428 RepID=A0A9P7YB12_9HELO|nr:hypothetical protein BJ875DRAFT_473599 [Amylocarpus encephaloides]
MASQQHNLKDAVHRSRDASTSSPLDHHTNTTTPGTNTRYSLGSSETGESSRAASNRNSFTTGPDTDGAAQEDGHDARGVGIGKSVGDGRGSRRTHRNKSSGGFLLYNSTFEPPSQNVTNRTSEHQVHTRQRPSAHDRKGKAPIRPSEKKHVKNKSSLGMRVRSSPLVANVTNDVPATKDKSVQQKKEGDIIGTPEKTSAPARLDVDSAQIVNLALNLNESRRNAARRNISTPLPPLTQGFAEGFAGGSLRHHLQQQRRASRNVSPKPDRGDRTMTPFSRDTSGVRISSPYQETETDASYQYHFSASTLARAEKAKAAIELMAHYRRLLQCIPPLKPPVARSGTSETGTAPGSPISAPASRVVSNSLPLPQSLGRPYNPLQYIRNRRVRLRLGKAIDGDSQGFADADRVSSWVDRISRESQSEEYQGANHLLLHPISRATEEVASPDASPQANTGKNQSSATKSKRPRNGWIISPSDMLADLLWLEQGDNKYLVEDNHGRMFPQRPDIKRPGRLGQDAESHYDPGHAPRKDVGGLDLRIDTKLPEFKSVKAESEKHSDSTASKAKQTFRHVRHAARIHHGHNGSIHEGRPVFRSHSKSDSGSSDSAPLRYSRRKRSGTANSNDVGADILEKQMMEMLAKEAKDGEWNLPNAPRNHHIANSSDSQTSQLRGNLGGSANHSRSGSIVNKPRNRDSLRNGSSGRASLEVPGSSPRYSLDELDSTAPHSPEATAKSLPNVFIPSIMDLSPPRSRYTSPTRTPLSKVKHKMNPFHDHHRDKSNRVLADDSPGPEVLSSKEYLPETPVSEEKRRRSISPVKIISGKRPANIRKNKNEDSSIKALFKSSRNPVIRVGDFIWKATKEQLPGISSGFSTDESDIEDIKAPEAKQSSRTSSAGKLDDDLSPVAVKNKKPAYSRDLPTFTSSFEPRGRPGRHRSDESKSFLRPRSRETLRKAAQQSALRPPPRIDVYNASPTSSPESDPFSRSKWDSSVFDINSSRQGLASGVRLNEVLDLPGKRRNSLPITGLANLEVSHDNRPPLDRKRQWSISDRGVSEHRGPTTKREIARVKALLLSSGIKAKEIARRAAELQDIHETEEAPYTGIAQYPHDPIQPVPRSKQHMLAARILLNDVQLSSHIWQSSADTFVNTTVNDLLGSIRTLQVRLTDTLTPMTRQADDEADELSKDLVTNQTMQVKRITDKIDTMMRRRRRRFRWARRGGWVIVEWALVGVMWYVWFLVVIARMVAAVGGGVWGGLKWLFWL